MRSAFFTGSFAGDDGCKLTGRANARPMTSSAKQSIAPAVIASEAKQSIRATRTKEWIASLRSQ
jgi:hypothetical protein